MRHTQSLQFWCILGFNLLLEPKVLLKTKISAKATSLGISNYISPRFQKDHRILVKLSKKNPFFGPKLGLNCPLGPHQKVVRNSHIAYSKTIHLYFLDAKFQLLGICQFRLYSEEPTTFFGSRRNWDHFFWILVQ